MKTINNNFRRSIFLIGIVFLVSTTASFAQTNEIDPELYFVQDSIELSNSNNESPIEQNIDTVRSEKIDTVHIRVGKHAVEIISKNERTRIDVERIDEFESKWEKRQKKVEQRKSKRFDGHWSGIDFGGNQLLGTTYPKELYPDGTIDFLTTLPENSFEVNVNMFEYSFGFTSWFGFVTGLGLNFNDYKFKNRVSLTKDNNSVIQPVLLPEGDFRYSKLSTTFITMPLLLEVQISGHNPNQKLFLAAGVIGGVKIHEHVKYRIGDERKRDNGDYNISPLRWGYTARIGFDNFGIYATYYNTPLFIADKGPETTPLTLGITLTF